MVPHERWGALAVKGVFEISGNSRYDDLITERYHFPSKYHSTAKEVEGDWILYRETRDAGGRKAYIATAFVERIDQDNADPTHYYARVRDYLPFDDIVPYRDREGRFAERLLREMASPKDAGRTLRGQSVRTIDNDDFVAIVNQGLAETLAPDNRIRLELDERHIDDVTANLLAHALGERRIEQILVNKKIRAASFRNRVLDAYDSTCAVTGLRIINGGGKAEAQAAHIWSVADGGPDVVPNGVALSATAHWLFDRHLISFDENLCLLVSHNKVPSELLQLFPPSGQKIRLPTDHRDHPHPDFVARHRSRFAGL